MYNHAFPHNAFLHFYFYFYSNACFQSNTGLLTSKNSQLHYHFIHFTRLFHHSFEWQLVQISRKGSDYVRQCYEGVFIIMMTCLVACFFHSQEQICQCEILWCGVLGIAYRMGSQYSDPSQMMSDKWLSHPHC